MVDSVVIFIFISMVEIAVLSDVCHLKIIYLIRCLVWSIILANSAINFTSFSGQPQIGCSGEGINSYCVCTGLGCNPPALASWFEDGERITGPDYITSELRQEYVVGRKPGMYTCEVVNGHSKVVENVTLKKYEYNFCT